MSLNATPEAAIAALPALFISDLHLCEEQPDTVAAFTQFLSGPARAAGSLFILGDLFEYWAGDDDIDTPFNRHICAAIRALSESGTAVYFMSGNRDLLMGPAFASASASTRLEDPAWIRLDTGEGVLLSHGDALCTDDKPYQAYREQVRNPAWQKSFLAQPLADRKAFIESLRKRSEAAKSEKPPEIMDINADALARLLREHGYPTLIHGHTHRPACHHECVDGISSLRWVLADWHGQARWLAHDGKQITEHRGPLPTPGG